MAKIESVTYFCDICGKSVENEDYLSKLDFTAGESFKKIKLEDYPTIPANPLRASPEAALPKIYTSTSFEACDKCMMRLYHYTMAVIVDENVRLKDYRILGEING